MRAFHVVVMVVMPPGLLRSLLGILLRGLLDVREILLRRLQISRLQVLSQLVEGLDQWIGAGLAGSSGARRAAAGRAAGLAQTRNILGQGSKILLGLGQITGLQVLPELLEFAANLLKLGLPRL